MVGLKLFSTAGGVAEVMPRLAEVEADVQDLVEAHMETMLGVRFLASEYVIDCVDGGDYAPIGQFGWDGGAGTTTYADPHNQLVGILLTQTGMSTPDSARAMQDFWTTLYQAVDD
ncbi:hypothetical protein Sviol_05530 [Streptomyces violascens]|uniref:Beta-lactamase-related domain-containing protein n=1 Tax=Streptomyces violascens TaxID=67381 RepID=A0ABQ3QFT6_9ACTN|nr:hypothetical protein Sviol_05530 [Streptomyces violascens]